MNDNVWPGGNSIYLNVSSGATTITLPPPPVAMIILTEFQLPCAASNNGVVVCRLEQGRFLPYPSKTSLRLHFITADEDFDRKITDDWRVKWVRAGLELVLTTIEKTLIDQHLQRLYKIRAFL
jgi:hypothetical protein